MQLFRERNTYRELLFKVDRAIEASGYGIGNIKTDGLQQLCLASFRLMRYIKSFLNRIDLVFIEGKSIPGLYRAIELVMDVTNQSRQTHSLALEAEALEVLSRACYRWLLIYQKL